jgi:CRP-like cAMP-binding protein
LASANDRTLEAIRLLAVLPPEVRHQLEAMCRWRRFVRNEEILGLQDRSRDVFMVVRGRVRVGIQSVGGRQIAIEERSEGGHFGEIEAIDGGPRCAGVIALTRATLAVISGSLFVDLCRRYPDFALAVACMQNSCTLRSRPLMAAARS